jgi:hypothetical protein
VRVADSSNFIISTTVAAALVTVRPGGLREMHSHPNADDLKRVDEVHAKERVLPIRMLDHNKGCRRKEAKCTRVAHRSRKGIEAEAIQIAIEN